MEEWTSNTQGELMPDEPSQHEIGDAVQEFMERHFQERRGGGIVMAASNVAGEGTFGSWASATTPDRETFVRQCAQLRISVVRLIENEARLRGVCPLALLAEVLQAAADARGCDGYARSMFVRGADGDPPGRKRFRG